MAALIVLLAAALALVGLGVAGRGARLVPGVAAAGLVAALAGTVLPAAVLSFGPALAVDGWSAVPLASLFLLAGCGGVRPVLAGVVALMMLAADGVGLALAAGAAVMLAGEDAAPVPGAAWMRAVAVVVCLAVAVAVLGGSRPVFAGMGLPPGPWGVVLAAAAVAAAAGMAVAVPGLGGLAGLYVVGRLLLDLPGPVTPGWWGGPVLVLGCAMALLGARRAAAAAALDQVSGGAGLAVAGVAALALGTALLARGADLAPLASMAVAGGLLLVLGWGVWGGLLALCGAVAPGPLVRSGGVMRRAPATGLALLAALLCLGAAPLTPGFAAGWLVLTALLGAGRTGGTGGLLLIAGAVSVLGLVVALLAAAAVRAAGMVLLGAPRTARAAGITEPPRLVRLGMAGLAGVAALLGVLPGAGLAMVQNGAALLAGGTMLGAGWWAVGLPDGPAYVAPGLAVLLGLGVAAAVWAGGRTRAGVAPPWQGGFIEDGVGRGNAQPVQLEQGWPQVEPMLAGMVVLGLCLAGLVGWSFR